MLAYNQILDKQFLIEFPLSDNSACVELTKTNQDIWVKLR